MTEAIVLPLRVTYPVLPIWYASAHTPAARARGLAGFPAGDGAVDAAEAPRAAGAGAGPVPAEAIPAGTSTKEQVSEAMAVFR
ncbi:hypothetical protein GCM10010421_21960 [Streptomyces glaucus]|uniref:Secreted protein n=1 Tax=Streptomyces glaucus TaxID=284029 RepID=A0ABN3JJX8_9ACTN